MASERNYTLRLTVGEDGTQYLLIREARPARHLAWTVAGKLHGLKAGFQKAFRFVSRRAS